MSPSSSSRGPSARASSASMTSGVAAIRFATAEPPLDDSTCSAQVPSAAASGASACESKARATGPMTSSASNGSPRADRVMRFSAATACSLSSGRTSATSRRDKSRGTFARQSARACSDPSAATFADSTQHCSSKSWSVLNESALTTNSARPCFSKCFETGCVDSAASHRSPASKHRRSGLARSDGAPGRPQLRQTARTVGSVESC
mmetsp:Transcript_6247/g.19272  ORF Transcript_6247/g.19272 Transcript_6247/m.19272 type:complete len:206 (+) Transcript_6247:164-781(+)